MYKPIKCTHEMIECAQVYKMYTPQICCGLVATGRFSGWNYHLVLSSGGHMARIIWWSYGKNHLINIWQESFGGHMARIIWWSYGKNHLVDMWQESSDGHMTRFIWWSYGKNHLVVIWQESFGGHMARIYFH